MGDTRGLRLKYQLHPLRQYLLCHLFGLEDSSGDYGVCEHPIHDMLRYGGLLNNLRQQIKSFLAKRNEL